MNRVILKGRLTKDPSIGTNSTKVAKYTLAVNRFNEGADFISCVAFGKAAEFAEKYLTKGQEILVEGRIQTGSYDKQDGTKVYTTDVVVERHEFCGSKGSQEAPQPASGDDDFMNIPDGLEEELPFN